ncbi:MAG: hypothetical protein HY867_16240 [Chloroflexi bacterium]|nr:hypothetical protein [Chloroflexota bacterium]
MASKRKPSGKKAGRDIVEINVTGNNNAVAASGGRATVSIGAAAQEEWKSWREKMESEIKALKELSAEDQSMLAQNVEQVVKEAEKGEEADPSRIERLLNAISAMAPDILDVIVTTIGNPLAGIRLVIKKIGEKAKVTRMA